MSLQCPATLILARHGEVEYESPVWGDHGGSLTATGREQSRGLAQRLAGQRVAAVWTSTMARAVQTGEIAAARLGLAVTTRHDLREFACGDLAGVSRSTDPFLDTFARWLDGHLEVRIPGGESGLELVARMRSALAAIADEHPGETVLVVTHGGALRLSVPSLCRMEVPAQRITHCATIRVEVDSEDWVCRAWDVPPD